MDNNIEKNKNQVLEDIKANGKQRPWKEKKINNTYLNESYDRLGYIKKTERTLYCGNFLEFKIYENNEKKLNAAMFCQVRLCPMCAWRREIKIFSQLSKVVTYLETKVYRFIFLTLTCENIYGENLSDEMDKLLISFKRMFELKKVKQSIKGYFRAMEITHDTNRKITSKMYKERKSYYDDRHLKIGDINPNFDKYHPHFHVMLVVEKCYFTREDLYISQEKWTDMWQRSMRVDYKPMVDVRAVRNNNNKGIKEVAKYSVKDTDYIVKQDKVLTDETVKLLDDALDRRRLVAYGGIMRDVYKELGLEDKDTADVHITEDGEVIDLKYILERYSWHVGYKNYILEVEN